MDDESDPECRGRRRSIRSDCTTKILSVRERCWKVLRGEDSDTEFVQVHRTPVAPYGPIRTLWGKTLLFLTPSLIGSIVP